MSELVLEIEKKLPECWTQTTTDFVCKINSGIGFPIIYQGEKNEKYPFYKVGDISKTVKNNCLWLNKSDNYVSQEICEFLKGKPFPKGTIVFAKIGEAIKMNRRAIASTDSLFDNNVMGLIPNEKIVETFYLYYFFNTIKLGDVSRSTTVPSIRKADVESIVIPIPPLNEQKRIVEKIDKLFSELDNVKNILQKVKLQLVQCRQSFLKSAFEGKLTEEWRKRNQDQINAIEINDVKGKKSNSLFGWSLFLIGDIIELSKEKFNPLEEKNEIFIGLEHIERQTGKIIGRGNSKDTRSTKTTFKKGDVLYGKLRPYLNKVTIPDFDGVCSTDILVFSQNLNIQNKLLAYYFLENSFVKFTNKNMSGIQHPRISFDKISSFPILLPSVEEQKQIISKVEQGFSQIDNTENITNSILNQLEILRSSLLKQAFEGKLILQDPNDESAEILLQKIKQEKEQLKQKIKSKKRKKNV